jgi:hypothetical protein
MTAQFTHYSSFVDYMMGRYPGRHNPMSNNNEFSYPGQPYEYDDPKPLTEKQKTMIADAVEEMRPQIEAADSRLLLQSVPASAPARPEVDYTLSKQDIDVLTEALLLYGKDVGGTVWYDLREKLRRGFEVVVRDAQP